MLKKTITYTDFNGAEQTEDFYFNLTKAELIEMELSGPNNSFRESMQRIIDANNGKVIMTEMKRLIGKAYGERSEDGKRFLKSDEITQNFEGSGAYDVFFVELVTDADAASNWVRAVVPVDLSDAVNGTVPTPASSTQSPRERSEAQMQGHKKPARELSASEPVLETEKDRKRRELEEQLAALEE